METFSPTYCRASTFLTTHCLRHTAVSTTCTAWCSISFSTAGSPLCVSVSLSPKSCFFRCRCVSFPFADVDFCGNLIHSRIGLLAVQAGFVDDLTVFDVPKALSLVQANERCAQSGEGAVYGQLMVLGHSEFRQVDHRWLPFGTANQSFPLTRRFSYPPCLLYCILSTDH
jgi:hypothetical protein